ncbi:Glycerol-3-phosphate dehydrogenase SDP6 [Hibiscus syriacus]|uniref:glycerol-3-phosphate dehydrogenase n=1 Tax=Hibiscus syriacus TaxID=106335 RepID=A0A6A2WRS1_HIBSY|nr:Glycerol-3-phosphate dehydrogenase SDP6 [Hibiscus syriacus]
MSATGTRLRRLATRTTTVAVTACGGAILLTSVVSSNDRASGHPTVESLRWTISDPSAVVPSRSVQESALIGAKSSNPLDILVVGGGGSTGCGVALDAATRGLRKQPEGMKNEDWALLDRQALGVIRLTWNATVTTVISSSGNSKLNSTMFGICTERRNSTERESGEASTSSALHTESRGRTSERNSNRDRSKSRRGASFTPPHAEKSWELCRGDLGSLMEKDIVQPFQAVNGRLPKEHSSLLVGKLPDLKNVDVGLCEDCIFGKQKKVSFAKIGSLYYVTFIDNLQGRIQRILRKQWDQDGDNSSHDTITEWLAERMMTQTCQKHEDTCQIPKFLWAEAINYSLPINRGPSVPLDDKVPEEVLEQERNKPFTLKRVVENDWSESQAVENGLAERMNKTCKHEDTCQIPKFLWAEAINIAAYLINRGPSVPLDDKIPEEIIRSRDVIFNENVMYKDKLTVESSSSNTKAKTKEFAEFEEISGNDVQISGGFSQVESSMKDEMDSLMSNQTWETELPPDKKALHKQVDLQIKKSTMGENATKQDWLSKVFSKRKVLTTMKFSPVVKLSTIRLVLKIVARRLHRGRQEKLVCRLKKSLYGLKQAPDSGTRSSIASWVAVVVLPDAKQIIVVTSRAVCMKDMVAAKKILGMRIKRDIKSGTLMLSQAELSKEQSPKTEEEYAHVGAVSRYMNNSGKVHWEAVKWILRYLREGALRVCLYSRRNCSELGFSTTEIVALSTTEAKYVVLRKLARRWFGSKWSSKSGRHVDKDGDPDKLKLCSTSVGMQEVSLDYYSPEGMGLIVPKTKDGRVVFMLPWLGRTIAGTTDSNTSINPLPEPHEDEIQFILDAICDYLNVKWYPSMAVDPNAMSTESISRDYVVSEDYNGLVTITGGKWTTYRSFSMAEEQLMAIKSGKLSPRKNSHGGKIVPGVMDTASAKHLSHAYGTLAERVATIVQNENWVRGLLMGTLSGGEVAYCARNEYCETSVDFIARRSRLGFLETNAARHSLPRIIEILATGHNWDKSRQKAKEFLETFKSSKNAQFHDGKHQ